MGLEAPQLWLSRPPVDVTLQIEGDVEVPWSTLWPHSQGVVGLQTCM